MTKERLSSPTSDRWSWRRHHSDSVAAVAAGFAGRSLVDPLRSVVAVAAWGVHRAWMRPSISRLAHRPSRHHHGAGGISVAGHWPRLHLELAVLVDHQRKLSSRKRTPSTSRKAPISQQVLWIRNWRTLLHMHRADASCVLARWQHFSAWNDVMAAVVQVRRQIENTTLPRSNLKSIPAKFYPDLKRRSVRLFWRRSPKKKKNNNNNNDDDGKKMCSDVRSVPDPKIT